MTGPGINPGGIMLGEVTVMPQDEPEAGDQITTGGKVPIFGKKAITISGFGSIQYKSLVMAAAGIVLLMIIFKTVKGR